jgi:hypothetical protein
VPRLRRGVRPGQALSASPSRFLAWLGSGLEGVAFMLRTLDLKPEDQVAAREHLGELA